MTSRSRTPTRARVVAIASLLTMSLARSAYADPSPTAVEEGRAHFQKGVALYKAGDFRAALGEFKQANAVAPSFRIQFNIGQTCAELQDHACASNAFSTFLADGGKEVPPTQRVLAEKELKRLRGLVGNVRILIQASGAEIAIDGVTVGTSPLPSAVVVNAGRRKVTARSTARATVSSAIEVPAGETVEITLSFADDAPLTPAAGDSGSTAPSRIPFWIGVGTTGAFTIVTATFGVMALSAKSDLDATAGRLNVTKDELARARSKVDSRAVITDVFGGVTLLAAGITTYLFFKTKPVGTLVGVGPGTLSLTHNF